tara:strand:- start:22686 stop:23708 length:1023 start_codon:yes stop_codon:yes gene_type:complete
MAKLFRKGRFNFFAGKGLGQYLLYIAIEMVLVIAGILIALNINNLNERSKEEAKAQLILKELQRDMLVNFKDLEEHIENLELIDSLIVRVLTEQVTWEDYLTNPRYSTLAVSYNNISFKENAFKNLERYLDYFGPEYDSLLPQLESLYHDEISSIEDMEKRISDFSIGTIEKWSEDFVWFRYLGTPQMPEEAQAYFMQSPYYLNAVHTYRTYSSQNLLRMLRRLQVSIAQVYLSVDAYLEKEEPAMDSFRSFYQKPEPQQLKSWLGNFSLSEANTFSIKADGNEQLKIILPGKIELGLYLRNDSTLYCPDQNFEIRRNEKEEVFILMGERRIKLKKVGDF